MDTVHAHQMKNASLVSCFPVELPVAIVGHMARGPWADPKHKIVARYRHDRTRR